MSTNPQGKGPFGYSDADKSEIKSVDNEKSEAVSQLNRLVQDQQQQREEIDSIKVGMEQLAGKMQEMLDVINKQSDILGGAQNEVSINGTPQNTPPQPNVNNLIALKDILDSNLGTKLIERLFPSEHAAPALIDNSLIQDKMKKTFFDNLETGESINNFIKNSLKKSVTKEVINSSLKDIGKQTITHEPA